MRHLSKVEGYNDLYRDEKTGAIINCDNVGYENYINNRRMNKDKKNELESVKKELNELKSLLNDLASKINSQ